MERLKQVENKHMKILDHQGMKYVRYVVFDESPLLMIITFIITILTTVMQHWNCTTFILLRREESGKGRGDLQQAKILNTSSSNFKLLEKLENPWGVPLGGESPGFTPWEKSAGLLPRGESLIDFSHVILTLGKHSQKSGNKLGVDKQVHF